MDLLIPIIPVKQTFYNSNSHKLVEWNASEPDMNLDYEAIARFCALGFFLGDSTYFKEIKVLPYGSNVQLDDNNKIQKIESYWKWKYEPRDISLKQAIEEFIELWTGMWLKKWNERVKEIHEISKNIKIVEKNLSNGSNIVMISPIRL